MVFLLHCLFLLHELFNNVLFLCSSGVNTLSQQTKMDLCLVCNAMQTVNDIMKSLKGKKKKKLQYVCFVFVLV